MLAGVLRSDHNQSGTCTKLQEAKVTVSQPVVTSSHWQVPSSIPEHSLLIEQPVVRGSNSRPVSVHKVSHSLRLGTVLWVRVCRVPSSVVRSQGTRIVGDTQYILVKAHPFQVMLLGILA
jgi:hypothetical protein